MPNKYEEKAKELVDKFHWEHELSKRMTLKYAKECAIICCDEVLALLSAYDGMYDQEFFDADIKYYEKLKEEINKL